MITNIYDMLEPRPEHDEYMKPRYVGKTIHPINIRYSQHIYDSKNKGTHKCHWMKACLNNGYKPIIRLLFTVEGNGVSEEIIQIKLYKEMGYNLVNTTNGGEGSYGHHPSEATRRKLSLSHIGKKRPPVSKETRIKLSKIWKGKHFTEEMKKKISEAKNGVIPWNKGKSQTQRQSLSHSGWHHSEETKRKMSQKRKGVLWSDVRTRRYP